MPPEAISIIKEVRTLPQGQKKTHDVKEGTLQEELVLAGNIDATEKVTLQFQTSGRLSYIAVKDGDLVKKGQLIAQLDSRELKKRLQKDLNDYKSSRWDLEQQKDDQEGKAITDALQRALDKTQFTLDSSVLDVELTSLSLEFSRLVSPINGIVTFVESPIAGVNITPSSARFAIVNPDTLRFVVTADQKEIVQIKEGQAVEISLDALDKLLMGKVHHISFAPKVGETSIVYEVFIEVSKDELVDNLRLGMTGDARFVLSSKNNAISIPATALQSDEKGDFVWKKVKGKKQRQDVTIGIETESEIEIVKGLSVGDVVYD
ncbi:MAG: Macrolide export protein MacA [Microgenomates bacterium OLB22]|nr:MAG: Macrolide export protein MacA [Microgenomates bacterium OLB22]